MAGTSFGILLVRGAVVAWAAAIVWAQGEDSIDNGDVGSVLITILKFYAILTGIAFVLVTLAGIPFACKFYCFRKGEQDFDASTANGEESCGCGPKEVGGVLCVTLCWPIVVAGFGCWMFFALGAALRRFKRAQENDLVGGDSMKESDVDNFDIRINKDNRDKTPSVSVGEEGDMSSMGSDLE